MIREGDYLTAMKMERAWLHSAVLVEGTVSGRIWPGRSGMALAPDFTPAHLMWLETTQ